MVEKVNVCEQMNFTIGMLTAMVIEELAEDLKMEPSEILPDFCASKTGRGLYDESTKLWWNGPSYIADMYKLEISARPH